MPKALKSIYIIKIWGWVNSLFSLLVHRPEWFGSNLRGLGNEDLTAICGAIRRWGRDPRNPAWISGANEFKRPPMVSLAPMKIKSLWIFQNFWFVRVWRQENGLIYWKGDLTERKYITLFSQPLKKYVKIFTMRFWRLWETYMILACNERAFFAKICPISQRPRQ